MKGALFILLQFLLAVKVKPTLAASLSKMDTMKIFFEGYKIFRKALSATAKVVTRVRDSKFYKC